MQLRSCHSYCNSAGFPQRLNRKCSSQNWEESEFCHFCYHGKPRVTYCFKIKLRFFVFQKKHYSSFSEVVILSPRLRFEFEIRCQKSFQHLPLQQPIWFNVALCLAMYCLSAITKKGGLMAFHGSEGCGNIAVPKEIEALPENLAMCCPRYQVVQHLVKLLGPTPFGCACWVETYLNKIKQNPILDSCNSPQLVKWNALEFHNLIEPGYDAKPIWQSSLAVQPQRFCSKIWCFQNKKPRGVPAKRVKIVQRLCNKHLATSCWHHTSGCFCHAQLFIRDLVRCAEILRQQKPTDKSYIHLRSSYSKIDCLPQAASIYWYCMPGVKLQFLRPSDSLHVQLKNHKYKLIAQSKPWRLSSQLGVLVGHEGCFDLPSFVETSGRCTASERTKFEREPFWKGSSINTWSLMNFNTT